MPVHGFPIQTAGFECRCWTSGSSFLCEADVSSAGCGILDVRMPDKDGYKVQRELAERRSRLQVIMVSGHGDFAVAAKAKKAGAFDFVEKPYDRDILITKVEQALAREAG